MTTDIKAAVLRNELAIIIGCLDGRSAHEKAESVIAWMDKYDQRATIPPVAVPEPVAQGWDDKLFNFIDSVVEVAFEGGDLDGGTIQEWAETAGLLEARTMTEPCSEGQNCRCADGNDFPLTCYQKTYRRAAAPAQAATDEVRDAIDSASVPLFGADRETIIRRAGENGMDLS